MKNIDTELEGIIGKSPLRRIWKIPVAASGDLFSLYFMQIPPPFPEPFTGTWQAEAYRDAPQPDNNRLWSMGH